MKSIKVCSPQLKTFGHSLGLRIRVSLCELRHKFFRVVQIDELMW